MDELKALKADFLKWRRSRKNRAEPTPEALRRRVVMLIRNGTMRSLLATELGISYDHFAAWLTAYPEEKPVIKQDAEPTKASGMTVVNVMDAELQSQLQRLRTGIPSGAEGKALATVEHGSGWRLTLFVSDESVLQGFVAAVSRKEGGCDAAGRFR